MSAAPSGKQLQEIAAFNLSSKGATAVLYRQLATPFHTTILLFCITLTTRADTDWILSPNLPGDWSVPQNWSNGVPTESTNAYINNGGTVTITLDGQACNYLTVDGSSTVQMTGGTLVSAMPRIGGNGPGTFDQSGGTFTMSGGYHMAVDTGSTYKLSGNGVISAWYEYIGEYGSGSFVQDNGSNSIKNLLLIGTSSQGNYTLNGGTLNTGTTEIGTSLGSITNGTFTQTGGKHTAQQCIYLDGIYDLSGTSSVSAGTIEYIGVSGPATFVQSGGTNSVGMFLFLGTTEGSSGTYRLDGGSVSAGIEFIGDRGNGTFVQSGGTNTTIHFFIGHESGSSGTYTLNGGTLALSSIIRGPGSTTFNFNGGILQTQGGFSTDLPMSLNTKNGNATIDTDSWPVSLSGMLSGPGNLVKIGSGVLEVLGGNTYTGDTSVQGGTLSIATPYLCDLASVSISSGAILDLTFIGGDTVASLYLDGVPVAIGSWGSSQSGADHVDNIHFSGTGMLNVVPEPSILALLLTATFGSLLWWRRRC